MKRAPQLPLQTIIDEHLRPGAIISTFVLPCRLEEERSFTLWCPGEPVGKSRPAPAVTKAGFPYLRTTDKEKAGEDYIRECCIRQMDNHQVTPFLPVHPESGFVDVLVYGLMTPPQKGFFTGMPHIGPPDADNIVKCVLDALGGRAKGASPLAFVDDRIVRRAHGTKLYWDPAFQDEPGYPPTPGTFISIMLIPCPTKEDSGRKAKGARKKTEV